MMNGYEPPVTEAGNRRTGCTKIVQLQCEVGTAVAQWLRCCATSWKVAGSIPAGVSGFFIDIKSF